MKVFHRLLIRASIGLVFVVLYVGWRCYDQWQSEQAAEKLQNVLAPPPSAGADTKPVWQQLDDEGPRLVDQCLKMPRADGAVVPYPARKGKVYLRDDAGVMSNGDREPRGELDFRLPEELRAQLSDPEFTVVWIVRKDAVKVADYTTEEFGNHIDGCRIDQTVCVFDWPSKRALGWDIVKGDDPLGIGQKVTQDQAAIYGDAESSLRHWIEKLPLADQSGPLPPPPVPPSP